MNAIDYKVGGIKCDNPTCDFKDMSVEYKDFPVWLNKPCPKCGCNLLTQKDLDALKVLLGLVNIINLITSPFIFLFKNKKRVRVSAKSNGTGKVTFERID